MGNEIPAWVNPRLAATTLGGELTLARPPPLCSPTFMSRLGAKFLGPALNDDAHTARVVMFPSRWATSGLLDTSTALWLKQQQVQAIDRRKRHT